MSSRDDQMRLGEPSGAIWYTSEPGVVVNGGAAPAPTLKAAPPGKFDAEPADMPPCPEGALGAGGGGGMPLGGGAKPRFSPMPEA